MVHEFRLSPPGSGQGTSCDAQGAFVGGIPLLKRSHGNSRDHWEPRDCAQLSKQIGADFGLPIDMSSKVGGLNAICACAIPPFSIEPASVVTPVIRSVFLRTPGVVAEVRATLKEPSSER